MNAYQNLNEHLPILFKLHFIQDNSMDIVSAAYAGLEKSFEQLILINSENGIGLYEHIHQGPSFV